MKEQDIFSQTGRSAQRDTFLFVCQAFLAWIICILLHRTSLNYSMNHIATLSSTHIFRLEIHTPKRNLVYKLHQETPEKYILKWPMPNAFQGAQLYNFWNSALQDGLTQGESTVNPENVQQLVQSV